MRIKLHPYSQICNNIGTQFFKYIPTGITIHYTSGGSVDSSVSHLKSRGLAYHILIDRDGQTYQMSYLDVPCSHAGNANWMGQHCNTSHIAIAVANYGWMKKKDSLFVNAYGRKFDSADVVFSQNQYWEKVPDVQHKSTMDLLVWLCQNLNIKPQNICGHHEASSYKSDPGGIFGITMHELRSSVCRNIL